MKKLLISLVACSVLLLCVLTSCGGKSKLEFYEKEGSYSVTGRGKCQDTDIVIPETYKGKSVTAISLGAFATDMKELSPLFSEETQDTTDITSITIPASVKSIGAFAFRKCTSLTSVNIPEGVTTIEKGTFSGCTSLTSITIPSTVTTIGDSAFSGCTSLLSITIPNSVTTIESSAFLGCTALTTVVMSDSVQTIERKTFQSCTSLTSLSLDGIVEIEESAFSGCTSLQNFTIPASVTSIGNNAFEGCTALTEITIPNTVTNLGDLVFADTGENLVVSVSYDEKAPEGWGVWHAKMKGKALNVSEVYVKATTENVAKKEALEKELASCQAGYERCKEELVDLNERYYKAAQNEWKETMNSLNKEMNAVRKSQAAYSSRIHEIEEELASIKTTNQLN